MSLEQTATDIKQIFEKNDLVDQIRQYCDKWERIKIHGKDTDVPGYKQFLSDLLTKALVEKVPLSEIAGQLGVSRQRVYQIYRAFDNWKKNKGSFGY